MVDLSDKLRMVRRREMESRIDMFWRECTKAHRNMRDLLQEAKGFIKVVEESEEHERRGNYLSCMQRLDEFTYTVLEFNLALEKFDLPSNPRFEKTLNSTHKSSKVPLNIGSFYGILDPIPSNVSALSNTSVMQKKHKICPPDQLIDLDSSSSMSTDNLNMYFSELTTSSTLPMPKSELTKQYLEDCNVVSAMELTSMVAQITEKTSVKKSEIENEELDPTEIEDNAIKYDSVNTFNTITEQENDLSIEKKIIAEEINEVTAEKHCGLKKEGGSCTDSKINSGITITSNDENKDEAIPENISVKTVERTEYNMTQERKIAIIENMEKSCLAVKGHNGIEIQGINSYAVNRDLEDATKRDKAGFMKANTFQTKARIKGGLLPNQVRLKPNEPYSCYVLHIDTPDLFHIGVGDMDKINECHERMLVFYSSLASFTSKDDMASLCLNYCACRMRSSSWYRALVINFDFSPCELEVYLLDVGNKYIVHYSDVHPLTTEFTKLPAFARECYLVGLDPSSVSGAWDPLAKDLMREYSTNTCTVYVQEERKGSLGVLLLRKKVLINKQLIENNLAQAGNDCHHLFALEGTNIPQYDSDESVNRSTTDETTADQARVEFEEMGAEPALDNVLEAVTGYANRDEAEICKHYPGPPHTTCFKGTRCKKKHVQIHPEGWTLDKTLIVFQPIRQQKLLVPGSTVSVYVSHVASYNVVFAMLRSEESQVTTSLIDSLAPPQTLESLHARMNSVYALRSYRPLALPPAPHEMVVAPYSDGCWYRARVTDTHLDDNLVEVQYMDYGNRSWVKVSELRQLDECFCVLATQAYRCRLAGVKPTCDVLAVDQGYKLLQKLTLGFYFSALVISTSDSDMEVALFDKEGKEVAFSMSECGVVTYVPYTIAEEIFQVIPG